MERSEVSPWLMVRDHPFERMDARARMVRTLVCLVAAMSGTAALLGWLDPSPPSAGAGLPPSEIHRLARAAVADDVIVQPERWRGVHVSSLPSSTAATLLSATARPEPCHFRVGSDGWPRAAVDWREQRPIHSHPDQVVIVVDAPPTGEAASATQTLCLRALISNIAAAIGRTGSALTVAADSLTVPALQAIDLTPVGTPTR